VIEGIKEIGEKILSEAPEKFLESLVLNVPSERQERQGRKQHIVIIEFDTAKGTINFNLEEISEETPQRYLWVGNATSPNDPQDRFTTPNLEYLVSQTLPNFRIFEIGKELGKLFDNLKDKFYYNLGSQKGQKERYRYMWNIGDKKIVSEEKRKLLNKVVNGKDEEVRMYLENLETKGILKKSEKRNWEEAINNPKTLVKLISKEVYEYLKREKNVVKKDISLFTLKIDGKLLVNSLEYRKYLENTLIEELFSNNLKGVCHVCQKKKEITQDMTRLNFKYYIIDKIGFSSGLHKEGFLKNFSLCKDCYKNLLAGESFIKNNLRGYLAGMKFYIIPKLIFDTSFSIDTLKKMAEYIMITFNSATSLEGLKKFQDALEDYIEFEKEKNNFILNFLFYKKAQSEFKILKLIKDVPPSRFDILREKEVEVHDIANRLLGDSNRWYLNLRRMYYLLPVRKSKKEVVDYKKVLEFYDSLFSANPISYRFLIEQFIELICVYRFEKFDNYNIGRFENTDIGLVYAIIEANLLLLYLRKLNLLQGGEVMKEEVNFSSLPDDMNAYFRMLGYTERQITLFLLGYLIGEVGNAQWSKENPNKPILNKIIYQGMNIRRIMRLTNEIFEKLKQWKKLSYNERIFGEMKRLLDKQQKNWTLSDQENVFYVLSGYAYNTYCAISLASKQKEAKEKGGTNDNAK